jgi:hypothetical protein
MACMILANWLATIRGVSAGEIAAALGRHGTAIENEVRIARSMATSVAPIRSHQLRRRLVIIESLAPSGVAIRRMV